MINRYKLKDGIGIDEILTELKERKLPHSEGGSFVHKDASIVFWHTLVNDIEVNVALPEDLTKGHNIAGTGEMLPDGTVGRIGGIDLKVIAADRKGMEIMFAPDDEIDPAVLEKNPDLTSNYDLAVKTAKKIGTKMKIVPVKTVDDALAYLDKLEPK